MVAAPPGSQSGATKPVPGACEGDKPEGETGLFKCKDGRVHRPVVVKCPSRIVDDSARAPNPADKGPDDKCARNADCKERPHGYCAAEGQLPTRRCHYGCTADSDCGEGSLCMCDVPVGRCVPATCLSDKDCGKGLLCARAYAIRDLGYGSFSCDTTQDECNVDSDCIKEGSGDRSCVPGEGKRQCVDGARPVY